MPTLRDDGSDRSVRFFRALRVGRGPDNDLVLTDPTVSSAHARVELREGSWFVRDLGSSNGTRLDGAPVTGWVELPSGAQLAFGRGGTWTFDADRAPAPAPTGPWEVDATARTGVGGPYAGVGLTLVQRGDYGDILVLDASGEHRFPDQELRFHLLLTLARELLRQGAEGGRSEPGWLDDESLRLGVWGRRALENQAASTLAKLMHDTRSMLAREGIDAGFIEKKRGRSRLALDPRAVVVR